MQLNKIEKKFFSDILNLELGVPVRATLKVYDDEFPVMVIPQLTQNDYFELRYFGTPPHIPRDEHGSLSWENGGIFGVHPTLEKAWREQDTVNLEIKERPQAVAPFKNMPALNICANVLIVEQNHRGRLAIHENQVLVKKSPVKQAEFCLVDFPAFKRTGHILGEVFQGGPAEFEGFQNDLRSIQNRFTDELVEITITKPIRTTLRAGDEWEITLTEEADRTRNHVTHSALITKTNDEEFEVDELRNLLVGLNQFFAFVSCAYRHPTAVIAKNSQDEPVWGQIGKFSLMPKSTNWFNNDSSITATVYLESLFPKFWAKWREKPGELTAAIESYVNSKAMQQSGVPKEALAASFAGLEMLANLVLPNPDPCDDVANVHKALDRNNIPHRKFKESETPITKQLARVLGANNTGPDLINSVRNYVAHPLERNSDTIKQKYLDHLDENYSPYFYLHDLCQFYLEYLFLIGFCNYQPQHFRVLAERR